MTNQKKRFVIRGDFDSFAVNSADELSYIISSRTNGKLSTNHRRSKQEYLGVIIYGYEAFFLRHFSDNLSRRLEEKEIDLPVSYIESINGLPENDLCDAGFYLIDFGWFVKGGWFLPNFTLIGEPY